MSNISNEDLVLIEALFLEEIKKLNKSINVDKSNEFIAKRYVANLEAEKIISKVLKRIKTKVIGIETDKVSYK